MNTNTALTGSSFAAYAACYAISNAYGALTAAIKDMDETDLTAVMTEFGHDYKSATDSRAKSMADDARSNFKRAVRKVRKLRWGKTPSGGKGWISVESAESAESTESAKSAESDPTVAVKTLTDIVAHLLQTLTDNGHTIDALVDLLINDHTSPEYRASLVASLIARDSMAYRLPRSKKSAA